MRSMKGLSMNKMLGSIRKKDKENSNNSSEAIAAAAAGPVANGTPEENAHNFVKAFCEAGANNQGDEVLFLPAIVEAAESSPTAAAECTRLIRKFMGKDYLSRPSWQYNAIMLVRILTDNPGETFTRNIDQKFIDTARQLLKATKAPKARLLLIETLDDFEHTKADDGNLSGLVQMWREEKPKVLQEHGGRLPPPTQSRPPPTAPFNPHSQNYFSRSHTNKRLPDPIELASRLEEARTSSKLLEQVVMNTPPHEILGNDLIKEFADRCQSASRSIQQYMVSDNPAPDNETMGSLIDTNEQLQAALHQHQRSVLNARKQLGLNVRSEDSSPAPVPEATTTRDSPYTWPNEAERSPIAREPSTGIARKPVGNGKGRATDVYAPPPGPPPNQQITGDGSASTTGPGLEEQPREISEPSPQQEGKDPFADPRDHRSNAYANSDSYHMEAQRHADEPFHPGFSPTQDYAPRQDRVVGNLITTGGVDTDGTTAGSRPPRPVEQNDDDDLYEATPRTTGPMYRY